MTHMDYSFLNVKCFLYTNYKHNLGHNQLDGGGFILFWVMEQTFNSFFSFSLFVNIISSLFYNQIIYCFLCFNYILFVVFLYFSMIQLLLYFPFYLSRKSIRNIFIFTRLLKYKTAYTLSSINFMYKIILSLLLLLSHPLFYCYSKWNDGCKLHYLFTGVLFFVM